MVNIPKAWDAVVAWWSGKWEPYEKIGGGFVVIGGTTTHHWTAKVARAVWRFVAKEWKWIIGTLIALGFFRWLVSS